VALDPEFTMVNAGFYKKWISVEKLKLILSQNMFLDHCNLFPNEVGNLTAIRKDDNISIGYIDFSDEKYHPF
jgi:hypothetical protein